MPVSNALSLLLVLLCVSADAAGALQKCTAVSLDLPDYSADPIAGFKPAAAYLAEIDELKKQGIYSPALVPVLLEFGLLQQQNNAHDAAINYFTAAMLTMKVNNGLYHAAQLSIIDLLITSHIALENWQAVTDYYDKKYWLINRNYPDGNPAILPIIKEVRQWHRDAYNKQTGRSLQQHFTVSEKIYHQAMAVIERCGGTRREAYCFWHRACCADARPEYGVCPLDKFSE